MTTQHTFPEYMSWGRFLQITQKHFFLVEHFCGLMFCLFWVNEDGAIKICSSISDPHFFNSAYTRAHQAMGLDKDTVTNLQPHVIITELLKVVATGFAVGHFHRDIFFFLFQVKMVFSSTVLRVVCVLLIIPLSAFANTEPSNHRQRHIPRDKPN